MCVCVRVCACVCPDEKQYQNNSIACEQEPEQGAAACINLLHSRRQSLTAGNAPSPTRQLRVPSPGFGLFAMGYGPWRTRTEQLAIKSTCKGRGFFPRPLLLVPIMMISFFCFSLLFCLFLSEGRDRYDPASLVLGGFHRPCHQPLSLCSVHIHSPPRFAWTWPFFFLFFFWPRPLLCGWHFMFHPTPRGSNGQMVAVQ